VSAIEILAVIGIIGYVIFKQVRGEPLRGKRAVLLPAILTVIGFTDLHGTNGAHLGTSDITALVIGTAGSALIGLAFGAVMRLEERGGYLWAQLPMRGLWLWGAMVAWRIVAFGLADAMHAHVAASSSTLLFSLGVNRLAQAAVIVPRAMAMGVPFAPEKDGKTFMSGLFERNGAGASGWNGTRNDNYATPDYRTDNRNGYTAAPEDERPYSPGYSGHDASGPNPYVPGQQDPYGAGRQGGQSGWVDLGRNGGRDQYDENDRRNHGDGYDERAQEGRYDERDPYDRQQRRNGHDRRDRHDRHDRRDRNRGPRY
jgi:hypothetical protein